MALKVWLPLNGNIENNGTGYADTILLNSPTYTAGKIGQALFIQNDGQGVNLSGYMSTLKTFTNYSMAAWVYLDATATNHSSTIMSSGDWNVSNGNCCFGFYQYSNNAYNYLLIPNKGGWSTSIYLNDNYKVTLNKWYHVAVTYDGTKTIGYINGEKVGETSTGGICTNSESDNLYVGRATYYAGFTLKGKINDVRIYDNALSAKEIKEISRALVIHYKLNSTEIEPTTNLLSAKQSCQQPFVINLPQHAAALTPSTCVCGNRKITYSAYIINTSSVRTNVRCSPLLVAGSYGTFQGNYIQPGESGWSSVTVDLSDAEKYTGTIYVYFQNGSPGTVPNSPTIYVQYAQVEANDHRTGWVLGGTSRENTIIPDSSGYNNYGISGGGLSCVNNNNSGRYNISTEFSGDSTGYIKVKDNSWMAQGAEAFTINLWVKNSSFNAGTHFFSCTESGGFNTESGNSGCLRFPIYVYTASGPSSPAYRYDSQEIQLSALSTTDWNMLTFVYNSTGTRTYINGNLHHTYTNTSYGVCFALNTSRLFLGCEANATNPSAPWYNGQESDFRFYYTALSEEDIKELYNNPANIDNLSNFHGYEFIENDIKDSIYKNGIISNSQNKNYLANNFSKSGNTDGWYLGTNTLLSDGTLELTGTAPNFNCQPFTVNPDDIIVFSGTVSVPTPSTTTGGPGVYIGTKYGQHTIQYYFSKTNGNKWLLNGSDNTNPYFVYSYNSTNELYFKSYILGSNVDINDVPPPEYTSSVTAMYCMKLPEGDTTTYIRSGYNTNTSMVIHLYNFEVYNINDSGIYQIENNTKIGQSFLKFNDFIEK